MSVEEEEGQSVERFAGDSGPVVFVPGVRLSIPEPKSVVKILTQAA